MKFAIAAPLDYRPSSREAHSKGLRLFADDIPEGDLRALIHHTYTPEIFGTEAITPVKSLADGVYLLSLSNGPTFAFLPSV
jgi:threonine synthase